MRDSLFLARKDLKYLIRNPFTILWGFVMPVIFFGLIGKVTANMGGAIVSNDPLGVWLPKDAGYLGGEMVRLLRAAKYDPEIAASEAGFRKYATRLTIPPNFTADILRRKPVKVVVERSGEGLAGDYDKIRVARACYSLLAEFAAAERESGAMSPEVLSNVASRTRAITIDVKAAGKARRVPVGFQQSVPGSMVQFLLLVMLTSGGVSVLADRRQGILRRLAASAMSRGAIITGKGLARLALGLVQSAFAMITGTLIFGVDWGEHPGAVLLIVFFYAAFCAALGILLGITGKTEGQVIGLGVLLGNVLAAIGGCWWPNEIAPQWMQQFALTLPTGIAMHGLHRLMSFGAPPVDAAPHLAALAAYALAAAWLATRQFRFE